MPEVALPLAEPSSASDQPDRLDIVDILRDDLFSGCGSLLYRTNTRYTPEVIPVSREATVVGRRNVH